MTPERWQQIKRIFHDALEVDAGARRSFLVGVCGDDAELLKEVEGLFDAHEQTAHLVDRPVAQVAARLIDAADHASLIDCQLGPYRITGAIGRGGMGEVYLAQDTRLGRRVAIKLLPSHFTSEPERVRRFQQEARAASALNHPNIVTIHEIGQQDALHFIVTEFIEGETLRALAGRGLPFKQALDIAVQTAEALSAAHQAGITHRDIKPENIMLRPDGYVKVLDFGLAKLSEPQAFRNQSDGSISWLDTSPGIVMGTVSYMSPEQVRGHAVDARTDIFSLGVVLYEIIAGRKPFAGETTSDIIAAILEREPTPLLELKSDLPYELQRIITKALAKDRNWRYQSSKDLLIDLRLLKDELEMAARLRTSGAQRLNGAPSGAAAAAKTASKGEPLAVVETAGLPQARTDEPAALKITGSLSLVERAWLRKKTALVLAMLVVVAVLSAGAYDFWLRREPAPAGTGLQAMSIARVVPVGTGGGPALSADGKYAAYMVNESGKKSIWVRQVATGSAVQIVPAFEVAFWGISFSPDANFVYYVVEEHPSEGVLYQVPTLGGTSRKLLARIDTPVTFSPDGKRMAFMRKYPGIGEFTLMSANSDGSDEQKLVSHKLPEMISWPAWSPGGKTIAYGLKQETAISSYWRLFELRLADGQENQIAATQWRVINQLAWLPSGKGLIASAQEETMPVAQLWQVTYPYGEVKRITNDLNYYRGVSLSADASLLASLQIRRPTDLWVLPQSNLDQGRPITGNGLYEKGVCWLPDGRIACVSIAGGANDVWLMNADGSNEKQLTSGMDCVWLTASPDGRYIVFASRRGATFNLWRINMDGSDLRQLTSGYDSEPHCAPDNQTVIYLSYRNGYWSLWRIGIDGGEPQQLVDQPTDETAISPDGKWIAYIYLDEQQKRWRIAVMAFTGGPPDKTFDKPQSLDSRLRWAPNSRNLYYTVKEGRAQNIWMQPLDGGPPRPLTHFASEELFDFDWSRDGRQIVCTRGIYNSEVVLIKNFTER
jgi:eukaryotic-like serine/threonine-protein kinase